MFRYRRLFSAKTELHGFFSLLCLLILAACAGAKSAPASSSQTVMTAKPAVPTLASAAVPPSLLATPTSVPLLTTKAPDNFESESSPTLLTITPPTATPYPTATPTANPYTDLTIDALANHDYGGGQLAIVETLEVNESFTRYLITYPSDGLTIYGYMNIPNQEINLPVVIALHGYIDPANYQTIDYTTRYADALAEAGYLVLHPNFRNYPPSDDGPDPFRVGYARDVLNLIAIIRQQSKDPNGPLRRADADNIHLWGHSMGGGIALRVITINNDPYIRAAVLYGSMSGDEVRNFERIQEWSGGLAGDFELAAPQEMIAAISPINHLERIEAAVSIHHSNADQVVPPEWSDDLCQRLEALDHPLECYTYEGLPHTFSGQGDALFIQRTIDFFHRY